MAPDTPATPLLEEPTQGGSYRRNADGTLELVHRTLSRAEATAIAEAAAAAAAAPAPQPAPEA